MLAFSQRRKAQFEAGDPFHIHAISSVEEATALVGGGQKEVEDLEAEVRPGGAGVARAAPAADVRWGPPPPSSPTVWSFVPPSLGVPRTRWRSDHFVRGCEGGEEACPWGTGESSDAKDEPTRVSVAVLLAAGRRDHSTACRPPLMRRSSLLSLS